MFKPKKAVFTIIATNYTAQAKIAIDSFKKYNQGYESLVITVEKDLEKLGIEDWKKMAFQYKVVEMCTAVKPSVFKYLFEKGFEEVIYIDPDTQFFGQINEAEKLLNKYPIVVTPHIIETVKWKHQVENERLFLKCGIYNLGFVALRKCPEVERLLEWWSNRLNNYALDDQSESLFTDQKWFDLVPGFWEVGVLNNRGYNLAHWNLQEIKSFECKNNEYLVNGIKLIFYHFSQFEYSRFDNIGKHQKHFKIKDLPEAFLKMFKQYNKLLKIKGIEKYQKTKYKYNYFDNGIKIPAAVKKIYWQENEERTAKWKNPFEAEEENSFLKWLLEPEFKGSLIPRFLNRMFKDNILSEGKTLKVFYEWRCLNWSIKNLKTSLGFDNYFIKVLKIYRLLFFKNIFLRITKKEC